MYNKNPCVRRQNRVLLQALQNFLDGQDKGRKIKITVEGSTMRRHCRRTMMPVNGPLTRQKVFHALTSRNEWQSIRQSVQYGASGKYNMCRAWTSTLPCVYVRRRGSHIFPQTFGSYSQSSMHHQNPQHQRLIDTATNRLPFTNTTTHTPQSN